MATNVNAYAPNCGEIEALRAVILNKPLVLGLYRTTVVPDGSMVIGTLTEMADGGGRGYAAKALSRDIAAASAADKWVLSTNAQGRAEAGYNNAVLTWTFNAFDVADGYTVQGVFAYTWRLPFDAGAKEIKVGDVIKGVTSAATGVVAEVCLLSGTWAAGTAAGYLTIGTKTGTFQDGENITILGAVSTFSISAAGTGYALGDIITITQTGASGAKLVVTAVDGYGGITDAVVVEGGMNYTVDTGLATVALTGSGNDDAEIDISTLAATVYAVTNTGATADASKVLITVWAFPAGVEIATDGQSITWDMKLALYSGT